MKALSKLVDPKRFVVELNVDVLFAVKIPLKVDAPLAVKVVVATLTNEADPVDRICARAVPPLGTIIWSNFPVFAEILPVEAAERSKIPFVESIPNTVLYWLIQFSRRRKFELIVVLEAEIESDPRIDVVLTVAIWCQFFSFKV